MSEDDRFLKALVLGSIGGGFGAGVLFTLLMQLWLN